MDHLPPEILSRIIDYLAEIYETHRFGKSRLSSYATISHAWQVDIEYRAFRSLEIKLEVAELNQFRKLFTTGSARRARALARLSVELGKPLPQQTQAWWRSTLARLFTVVKEISVHAGSPTPLLWLDLLTCHSSWTPDWDSLQRDAPPMPELSHVHRFLQAPLEYMWEDSATAISGALKKLPNVENCRFGTIDKYEWGTRERIARREEFKTQVLALNFVNLKVLRLSIAQDACRDDGRQPPNLIPENESEDVSLQIPRHLATLPQLRILNLRGPLVIRTSFFRDIPAFPALAEFHVDFSASTADGKWFFERDEALVASYMDSDDEESWHEYTEWESRPIVELVISEDEDGPLTQRDDRICLFRTMPNETAVTDLLTGIAHFLESATCLRQFILRRRFSMEENSHHKGWDPWELGRLQPNFEFWYLRSGVRRGGYVDEWQKCRIPADEPFVARDRIYWSVGERWRPNAKIVDALRKVVGPGVKSCFLKEDLWDKAGGRGWLYEGDVEWEELGKDVPC